MESEKKCLHARLPVVAQLHRRPQIHLVAVPKLVERVRTLRAQTLGHVAVVVVVVVVAGLGRGSGCGTLAARLPALAHGTLVAVVMVVDGRDVRASPGAV